MADRSSRPHRSPTRTPELLKRQIVALRWRHRLGPVQIAGRRHRDHPIGFDYVHSMVDDHSRLAYSEVLPDENGATCAEFMARAVAYFAAHGITRIKRIMTDNAWAYRYSLRTVAADLGATQVFIKPHCPWQNGKVERLNRTLQTEWAYRQVFTTNADRTEPDPVSRTVAVG